MRMRRTCLEGASRGLRGGGECGRRLVGGESRGWSKRRKRRRRVRHVCYGMMRWSDAIALDVKMKGEMNEMIGSSHRRSS